MAAATNFPGNNNPNIPGSSRGDFDRTLTASSAAATPTTFLVAGHDDAHNTMGCAKQTSKMVSNGEREFAKINMPI